MGDIMILKRKKWMGREGGGVILCKKDQCWEGNDFREKNWKKKEREEGEMKRRWWKNGKS